MYHRLLHKAIVPGFALIVFSLLIVWLLYNPVSSFTLSVPGMDNRKAGNVSANEDIRIGENFVFYKDLEEIQGMVWNRFRGPDFDNINKEKIPLIDTWGKEGPNILWKKVLGEGHAAPAIYNGKIYILDYDERTKSDVLRCLSLLTGDELWNRNYKVHLKRNHGLSRTIPAVSEKYVVSIGPRGQVMCVDRLTGNLLWGLDLEKEFETEIPFWYTGQCPLIDNGVAVIATGGKALMIGVDCETGAKLWETPIDPGWKMSHSSIIPWTYGGRKMYVYSAVGGVCGVAAEGQDAGKILWKTSRWNHSVVAPSALCMPDGRIFLTAGYGAGSMVIQIRASGGTFSVEVIDEFKPVDGMACEQQTPVFWNGHVFAIFPKDAGPLRNQFVCMHPSNFRQAVWSSGKETRFGLGPYMMADNKFFILSDDGVLTIAQPSTKSWIQLDQVKLFEGQDAWAPIAVADGYMVLRDSKTMVCIDVRNKG